MCASAVSQEGAKPAAQDSKPQDTKAQESKTLDAKAPRKPAYTLTVKTRPIVNLSLKADKARLADLTAEISKRLRVPVFLGAGMDKQLVSVEFSQLTLEPAMQLLAPEVYIDYEIIAGSGTQPKPIGIFFYDNNQAEPPVNAVVPGNSQSLLIEGDTEEGMEPRNDEEKKKLEEQPLRIVFANNFLSVTAKHQPLPLVLLKIGDELGIPVDIKYQSTEIVDMVINKLPVEDAIRSLSPNISLYMRANLQHLERRALRLVLVEPVKTTQQGL